MSKLLEDIITKLHGGTDTATPACYRCKEAKSAILDLFLSWLPEKCGCIPDGLKSYQKLTKRSQGWNEAIDQIRKRIEEEKTYEKT